MAVVQAADGKFVAPTPKNFAEGADMRDSVLKTIFIKL